MALYASLNPKPSHRAGLFRSGAQQRASANGADRARWFGHTELYTSRANWARDENRRYVRRILLTLEPLYIGAGWYGVPVCPETP